LSPAPPGYELERFLHLFLEEAGEHIATLEDGLLRMEQDPSSGRDLIDSVFRAAHSIKGASATLGLQEIARFTHALESLLDRMRTGVLHPTPGLTSLLLRGADGLRLLLGAAQHGHTPPGSTAVVMAELELAMGSEAQAAASPVAAPTADQPREFRIVFQPGADIYRGGMDPLLVLRELADAGEVLEVESRLTDLPPLTDLDPESSYLGWTLRLRSPRTIPELREIFAFVEDGAQIEIVAQAAAPEREERPEVVEQVAEGALVPEEGRPRVAALESSTIRVAVDKVDRLVDLVGELVIAQSMVSQLVQAFSIEKLQRLREAVGEMERNTRELQERVMGVRMVPLNTVFSRVPRLARDVSGALGKKVVVQIVGGETEIDKSVIEQIGDPLTHLVRNAVDHGIEMPEERLAAGKPEHGTIQLSASHQGGNVVIEIRDDGKGLDLEKIRAKALAKGLLAPEAQPTREELHQLIFLPGFSTAAAVTDLSGRGVGMDVVRTNIGALNGDIALDSEPGRGTSVRISLPLTLAIVDGLCVGLGEEVYVVPLASIVESLRPRPGDIKTVTHRGEVVCVRGQVLPLIRLRRLLAVRARRDFGDQGIVVIVENQGAKVGVLVDNVQGQAQVVIKSLEAHYGRVEGMMGATIMGDGRVALILDVQAITRISHGGRPSIGERRAET
jgi:two-component system chemotaxis sensor kinase CheA